MSARVARIISIILHPAWINTCLFALFMHLHPLLSVRLHGGWVMFYTLLFFFVTAVIPIGILFSLKWMGHIQTFVLESTEERRIPLMITSVLLLLLFYLLKQIYTPSAIQLFVLNAAAITVSLSFVNEQTKVSLHMAAMGLSCGMLIHFSFYMDSRWLLALAIIMSGLTASARLFDQAHSNKQLIYGYVIGLICTIFILWP